MPLDLPFRPAAVTRPAPWSVRHCAWMALAFVLAGSWQPPAHSAEAEHRTAASSPRAAAAEDPMDVLRQKLAERLGAQKPDTRSGSVMRVDNHGASATPSASIANAMPRPVVVAPTAAPSPAAARVQTVPAHAAVPHGSADGHWDYAGEQGPQAWGRLKPEYAQCASGERQSPIDIRGGIAVQLEPIQFDYQTTGFSVIDNGHTVQVNLPAGNAITVLGRRFELLQFHFHRPSEERINGRQYDMVAHLVHKDAQGKLAVVAVLLDRGVAQPVIQAVWNALPLEKNEAQAAPGTIDLNKLLPEDRRYYTYMGSLTTPPCSEGVLWMVMKTPVPVSPEQVDIFAHLYPMNARPVQRVAGRLIKESN
jgi:carbonic anhydrase